ncbi:hypothetical protein B7P43_G09219, partial [Cryptotermes secundus]
VAQFRYLGTTITDRNLIQGKIKRRLNSGDACYHSVQNLLSSRLLSKNVKIRIYKTIILSVVLYGKQLIFLRGVGSSRTARPILSHYVMIKVRIRNHGAQSINANQVKSIEFDVIIVIVENLTVFGTMNLLRESRQPATTSAEEDIVGNRYQATNGSGFASKESYRLRKEDLEARAQQRADDS